MEVVTGNQSWMAGQGKILGYPMMFWGSSWWYVVCGEACMEYENQRFLEMHWCLCWVRSHLCLEGKHVTKCVFPSWHSDQQSTKGTEKNWGCIPLTVTKLGPLRRLCLVAQSWPTLCGPMDCSPPGFSVHGDSLGKNIGVGCHAPLQGGNPGIEPRSPPLQADSLPSEPSGKPRILEWVAYAFSWGSAWPRNQTEFFCIAGEFFIREVPFSKSPYFKRTIEE